MSGESGPNCLRFRWDDFFWRDDFDRRRTYLHDQLSFDGESDFRGRQLDKRWHVGLDWGNVSTTAGTAEGVGPANTAYSDPTAALTGVWGPNQTVTVTVYSNGVEDKPNQGYDKEVEIRLRTTISAHSITGYEINCRTPSDSFSYIQIVRWNGALGDFTSLNILNGTGCNNGDVLKATITGGTIQAYRNGTLMLTATDNNPFTTGNPGMGFNFGCGTAYNQFGLTNYSATDGPTSSAAPAAPTNLTDQVK